MLEPPADAPPPNRTITARFRAHGSGLHEDRTFTLQGNRVVDQPSPTHVDEARTPAVGTASSAAPAPIRATGASLALRLLLAPVATAVAFPDTVSAMGQVDGLAGFVALGLVVAAAVIMVATRVRPAVGEPEVHDRQLDLIAGLLLVAAAAWLSMERIRSGPSNEPTTRDVLAITVFLVGTSLLLWGTRMVLRLRWALLLPLLSLPVVTTHLFVAVPLIVCVIVAAALPLLRKSRAGERARRAVRRSRGIRDIQLPPLLPAAAFVVVIAGVLCASKLHALGLAGSPL